MSAQRLTEFCEMDAILQLSFKKGFHFIVIKGNMELNGGGNTETQLSIYLWIFNLCNVFNFNTLFIISLKDFALGSVVVML